MHRLLAAEPPAQRASRLAALRPDFAVPFSLLTVDDVAARVGHPVAPGDVVPLRVSPREEWLFFVFVEGRQALAAGPVHPAIPPGVTPIGVFVALGFLPFLAGYLALRVEGGLRKVERASEAIAGGELSARVANPTGPSTELAAKFNDMAERVERLIRSREELIQAVSHELGSPLSRLRFHLELLETQPEEEREERMVAMVRELDELDELVAELLDYIQSDDTQLDRQGFDPESVLTDLADDLYDYEKDVRRNSFNVLRGVVHAVGAAAAPLELAATISALEAQHEALLRALPPPQRDAFCACRRRARATAPTTRTVRPPLRTRVAVASPLCRSRGAIATDSPFHRVTDSVRSHPTSATAAAALAHDLA